jgi:endonuclease YncB( thermonuclease family)
VLALLTAVAVPGATAGRFTYRGVVSDVSEDNVLVVEIDNGPRVRVRLMGVETPARGECFANEARARIEGLALYRRVAVVGDPGQSTRDRRGRLLGYVEAKGADVGRQLLVGGYGAVHLLRKRPFTRFESYQAAQARAVAEGRGIWGSCETLKPPEAAGRLLA